MSSSVSVLDVSLSEGPEVVGWIDAPVPGSRFPGHALQVSGWTVGRRAAAKAVTISWNGIELRRSRVIRRRQDIAQHPDYGELPGASASGFECGVGLLGLPHDAELALTTVFDDGSCAQLGTMRLEHTGLPPAPPMEILPLMVTCLGRSGSTLTMRMLQAHPEVVVQPSHPHETRCATYWMQALKVIGEPGATLETEDWTSALGRLDAVGPNPFHSPLFTGVPEALRALDVEHPLRMAQFCREALVAFYRAVVADADRPVPRFFAEKQYPTITTDVLVDAEPRTRELLSVRDPRDMICSIVSFVSDPNNTFLSFSEVLHVDGLIAAMCEETLRMVDAYRRRGDRAHVVRYEDLVAEPRATVAAALRYAGLDDSPTIVERLVDHSFAETTDYAEHRTSDDLHRSVGRWRRDLDPRLVRQCDDTFGTYMELFGYEPSGW